jgi:hypothetical protein
MCEMGGMFDSTAIKFFLMCQENEVVEDGGGWWSGLTAISLLARSIFEGTAQIARSSIGIDVPQEIKRYHNHYMLCVN